MPSAPGEQPPQAGDVRRAADRARTTTSWLDSAHSFSFGRHYDPGNTSFGLLVAHNDDVVAAGAGFAPHPHRDLEIVTWVLAGSLAHRDSAGRTGVVRPGVVQRMSAGSGVVHEETNAAPSGGESVRLVQAWLVPDEPGGEPDHELRDMTAALRTGPLVAVASGRTGHPGAVRLRQRGAALHVARLAAGQMAALPEAPYVHLYVALGAVDLEGVGALGPGDAARLSVTGSCRVRATEPAEVLVWEMHSALGA